SGISAWPSKQFTLLKPAENSQPRGRARPSRGLSNRLARPSGVSRGPTSDCGLSLKLFQPVALSWGALAGCGTGTPGAASFFSPALLAASHSSVATEINDASVGGAQLPLSSVQPNRSCSLRLSGAPSLLEPSPAYSSSAKGAQRPGQPSFLLSAAL